LMGLARCIAMVVVWNRLAGGSSEFTAALVLFNSVFQILFFSLYAYLFIGLFLPGIGLSSSIGVSFSIADVAQSVAIYLFIPFGLGICTRAIIIPWKGAKWFDEHVKPIISPLTLLALLATIVLMFIMQGSEIVHLPLDILRIAVPLFLYFLIMFFVALFGSHALLKSSVEESITLAFTSASNNFELAIAVAVAVFGIQSDEAFATVVGPLVEVPVMLGLVHAARAWAKKKRAQERLQQQASSSTELTAVAQMK
jgi:ACR3 family arsenite transporter